MARINSSTGTIWPNLSETASNGAQVNGQRTDCFEIEDEIEDEDLDELAKNISYSSPFFTQPTQIVNRTTQPTQLVSRTTQPTQLVEPRTTLERSSPPIPDTPSTTIEVPASSPFQVESRTRQPTVKLGGRLASLMAPAGTTFRAPPAAVARINQPAAKKPFPSAHISDDDLANDYKREDSSEDEFPMRGEIRPSSFVKRQLSPLPVSKPGLKLEVKEDKERELNNISDLRLRYLTKQTHKIVAKVKPEITVAACRDALQRNNKSVEDAANSLVADVRKFSADSRIGSTFGNAPKPSTIPRTNHGPQQNTWKQTKLPTQHKSRTISSSPPPSPEPAKNPAPRRRLMQGRRNRSPTPPAVFSVSSSHVTSTVTTPSSSSSERTAKIAVSPDESQSRKAVTRHRKIPGPNPNVITIDSSSGSDSNSDPDLPDISAIASKKRKASQAPGAERKARPRLVSAASLRAKVKPVAEVINLSDDDETFASGGGLESRDNTLRMTSGDEHANVLEYLNSCTAEELARMTSSSLKDAQLVVSKRPFKSIEQICNVKAKGAKKSKKDDIGPTMVEKLDTWYKAFDAVTDVIEKCAKRGRELQAIMSRWEMDKNGKTKNDDGTADKFDGLPISARPARMAESIELKSYQLFGLNWMKLLHDHSYGGILADDMGLGKTCQVISFISHLVEFDNSAKPNLIVVPPSTLENWVSEFETFAPEVSVFLYSGTNRKDLDVDEARDYDVILTSYSQIERNYEDIDWLSKTKPYAAIFDEGHKLKNPKALVYKNLMRLPSEWRLVLTGTPVQNNLKELLSLLSFVERDLFNGDILEELQTIFEAKVPNKDVLNFAALAKERVGNARAIMVPFILQRRKDEVIALPKKIETIAVVKMLPAQREIYNEIKGAYKATYLSGDKGKSKIKDKGNPWMQLRKAAIHPLLFRRHFTDEVVNKMTNLLWKHCSADELDVQSKADRHKELFRSSLLDKWDFALHLWCKEFPRYIGHLDIPDRSWENAPKVQKLLELIKGYQANGDRCLVFSRFEMVIDILRETMHNAGIPYAELTGQAKVSDRFPEIERFNKDASIPVFLLTTGAGGTGLNLTTANKIILFDQSDNPQDDVQASNRAHRIGQTREVEIIRLITEGTVERYVYNSCVKKLMLAACVEGAVEDEETVEEECRKLMLFEDEADEQNAASSQMALD